jgi:hypothetical protein
VRTAAVLDWSDLNLGLRTSEGRTMPFDSCPSNVRFRLLSPENCCSAIGQLRSFGRGWRRSDRVVYSLAARRRKDEIASRRAQIDHLAKLIASGARERTRRPARLRVAENCGAPLEINLRPSQAEGLAATPSCGGEKADLPHSWRPDVRLTTNLLGPKVTGLKARPYVRLPPLSCYS